MPAFRTSSEREGIGPAKLRPSDIHATLRKQKKLHLLLFKLLIKIKGKPLSTYDLKPPSRPQRPLILNAPGPITPEGVLAALLLWAFVTAGLGMVIGFIFSFTAGIGPSAFEAQNSRFVVGFVLTVIMTGVFALMAMRSDYGPFYEQRRLAKAQYNAEYAKYERLMAEWPAELERRKKANEIEARRRSEEEAKRQKAREMAQAEALRKQREEEENTRLAAEAEARRRAWDEAFGWAKGTFEQEYHGLAVQLVATHGKLSEEDMLKVFVTAYPHMTCSTDWRMGCLRELAGSDRRIAAILPFLQPLDARNKRPS